MNVSGKRIVLGVSGGIAVYKVVELARELTQNGADVRVVMTEAAMRFVGPITFSTLTGNSVETDLFPEPAPREIPHTTLARSADLVVVAPATANVIGKYALGLADDLLSAILLATKAPVLMAPAMHSEMWEYEGTQANVRTLHSRGVNFVGPETGALAGPDTGPGRLSEITAILEAVWMELERTEDLAGANFVITAGGTREAVDAVRYLGNRSSGRMGFELAYEASRRGAKVTLISGPSHLHPPAAAEFVRIETTLEMKDAVLAAVENADVVVMAAAVADWRPSYVVGHKLKKAQGAPKIELEPTEDILAELGKSWGGRSGRSGGAGKVLVGFKAETEDVEENARQQLHSKSLDLSIGNLVGAPDSGFEVETNRAVMIDRDGKVDRLPVMTKRELARVILDAVKDRFL